MPTVFVVIREPFHETSTLIGVYSTLEKAKLSHPNQVWDDNSWYVSNRNRCVSSSPASLAEDEELLLIFQTEVV